jgi:hypothetical protein
LIRRIILHAGTEKTGTTALQVFLESHAEVLAQRGWFYPPTGEDYRCTGRFPKHRWVLEALMAQDERPLEWKLQEILSDCPADAHTLILSDEALYGDWPHVSSAGRAALAALTRRFDVQLWVWFREPLSYVRSQYVQMLKNPRGPAAGNGEALPIDVAVQLPWFVSRLDYIGFVRGVEAVLGEGQVRPFLYDGYTVKAFLDAAGLADLYFGRPTENVTPGWAGVSLLKALNRLPLTPEAKSKMTRLVGRLDALVGAKPLALSARTTARIVELSAPSVGALARDYGLVFEGWDEIRPAQIRHLRAA